MHYFKTYVSYVIICFSSEIDASLNIYQNVHKCMVLITAGTQDCAVTEAMMARSFEICLSPTTPKLSLFIIQLFFLKRYRKQSYPL